MKNQLTNLKIIYFCFIFFITNSILAQQNILSGIVMQDDIKGTPISGCRERLKTLFTQLIDNQIVINI